jgi:hypothetical protein
VAPVGVPVTATVTGPVKFVRVIVAVYDVLAPCCADPAAPERAIVIAGLGSTVRETTAVRGSAPVA